MDRRIPDAITLQCRRCGADIAAEDIELGRGLAKCRSCHAVFRFEAQLDAAPAPRRRGPVPLPERFRVEERGGTLHITRRWFSPVFIFLIFFCLFWDGFLVVWYGMAGKSGNLIMMLFPIIHVAVGAALTYWTIAGFVNRTYITASPSYLRIRHAPLPWPGNRELRTDDLDQLYCEERVRQHRNRGASTSYTVNAVLRDGRKLKLLSGLENPDEALYVEYAVEQHLGIEDRPVRGEMRS